ncbi:hypothetical protein [Methylobacterium sp. P1-11]|uniref:hypothetical protein n=1 Tax=Methylobacterium sp. P1-11 TaxID=2024616 RepID=UPI001FEEF907|nr:hypothetical protein [Methylobacterium sp. P1-11]
MRGRLGFLGLLLIPATAAAQAPALDSLREAAPGSARPPEAGSDAAAPDPGAPDLPFASTPDLRARTVAERLRRMQVADPLGAAVAARELARHDYDAIFRGFLAGTALRETDAGDVLAAFVVLQWMVANDATTEPSPAALRAIRRQFVAPLATKPPLSLPGARAAFAEEVKLRAVLHHAGWQAAKGAGTLPRFLATLPRDLLAPATLRTLAMTDDGLVPRDARTRAVPPAAAAPARGDAARARPSEPELPAEPRFPGNWASVEGVYFRAAYGVGVGGMMILRFEPLILLRDGTTYAVAAAALEDVDLTAERAAEPRRFGRWTRAGDTVTLIDDRGRADTYTLQDGRFFRAFPAGAGETVARSYRNLSGGGNTAMGGDVMIAVSNRYDFRADGTYGRGGSVGATNSGATSGVGSAVSGRRAPEGGRYALDRHTLTLTAPDGRVRRLFFAFASHGDPPAIDRDMIFVGDDAFTPPH